MIEKPKIRRKRRISVPIRIRALLQKEIDSKCPFCRNEDVDHFQPHHIDGKPDNNRLDNLLMVCAICHSKITKSDITEAEVRVTKLNLQKKRSEVVDDFPGIELAKAWVYTVINDLIYALEPQLKYLADEDWGFDRFRPEQLKRIKELTPRNIQGNYENFFQHQKEVLELSQNHDEKVRSLVSSAKVCHRSISESAKLKKFFEGLTSVDALMKLKDEKIPHQLYEFQNCGTRDEFLNKLFGNMSISEIMQLIAELLINNPPPPIYHNNFAPWWNLYHAELMSERDTIFKKEIEQIQQAGKELSSVAEQLYSLLKDNRNSLCQKYRFPPDEPRQTVVIPPLGSRF